MKVLYNISASIALSNNSSHANLLYIINYAKNRTVELCNRWNYLDKVKKELTKIHMQLRRSYEEAEFHIHPVSYPPYIAEYSSPSLGKSIVIDPPDPTKFLHDNFYIMQFVKAMKPKQSKKLEIYIFVTEERLWDPTALEKYMRMGFKVNDWDYFNEEWLTLIVVYNLPTVPIINVWLLKAREILLKNLPKHFFVKRSLDKQDCTLKAIYLSRMVGIGDIANQSGSVGPYLNFPKAQQLETSAKYEILEDVDYFP